MSGLRIAAELEISGYLAQDAEARALPIDGGHHAPCLCMEIDQDTNTRARWSVQQVFPEGHHQQCEAAARRLKRGMLISFHVPTTSIHMHARGISHVHVIGAEQEAAEAAAA